MYNVQHIFNSLRLLILRWLEQFPYGFSMKFGGPKTSKLSPEAPCINRNLLFSILYNEQVLSGMHVALVTNLVLHSELFFLHS